MTNQDQPQAERDQSSSTATRCHVCREEVSADIIASSHHHRPTCERCSLLIQAPPCKACGGPVRDADKADTQAYHEGCRRCSSCSQVVAKSEVVLLAGRLLCQACDHLFGKFFVPSRRTDGERMQEAFAAWDKDGNGVIDKDELRRVLKALKPDFPENDLSKLMQVIDINRNGVIEHQEFCDWIMKGSPMELEKEQSFSDYVAALMREAGQAMQSAKQDIAEVHVQPKGIYFVLRTGELIFEGSALTSKSVEMTCLEPEEFIQKAECTEIGLVMTMNTGRTATLKCKGATWGPWTAPEGFFVSGLRSKPLDGCTAAEHEPGFQGRICGTDLAPLPSSKDYDLGASLRFAAEREYMQTLQKILAKAAIDVNGFSRTGVTALMLAAQYGKVGACRLLLGSKANPAQADEDGWTPLTFASRSGYASVVELLHKRSGEKAQGNDGGAALKQALAHRHNSTARALLRAGFGPEPRGTFALEPLPDESTFTLPPPTLKPPAGCYGSAVTVEILPGTTAAEPVKVVVKEVKEVKEEGEEAEVKEGDEPAKESAGEEKPEAEKEAPPDTSGLQAASPRPGLNVSTDLEPASPTSLVRSKSGRERRTPKTPKTPSSWPVTILYTLDGRDPSEVGTRYRGPLKLSNPRNILRIMAVQGGKRSVVVDAVFVICHYALPDDIVTGSLKLRTIPEVGETLSASIAEVVGEPSSHVSATCQDAKPPSAFRWVSVQLTDPVPRHSMLFDRSYATIRGKMKQFLEKFKSDIEKAIGVAPTNCEVEAVRSAEKTAHKAGAIGVEFVLPRELALKVEEQLGLPDSFLMTKAKMKALYKEAEVDVVEPLTERLKSREVHDKVLALLKKYGVSVDDIVGVGQGESGFIAVAVNEKQVKKIKDQKLLVKAVKEVFEDAEIGELRVGAEYHEFEYAVDVCNRMLENGDAKDGGVVVSTLNGADFAEALEEELADHEVNLDVVTVGKASSRGLSQLELHVEYDRATLDSHHAVLVKDYLDAICLVYSGNSLSEVIDFRSAASNQLTYDGPQSGQADDIARSIGRAIRHSGDIQTDKGGEHHMYLDLNALPEQVSDLFFVLAAFDAGDLSLFGNPTVQIHDAVMQRQLTEYSLPKAPDGQAVLMCSLSRDSDHKDWVLHGLGIPTSGNANNYDGIRATIADRQASYSHWERRKSMVLLRVLHKKERMAADSSSEFAELLWKVLKMPLPNFQSVVTFL